MDIAEAFCEAARILAGQGSVDMRSKALMAAVAILITISALVPSRAAAGTDSEYWNGVMNGCTGLGIQSAVSGGTPSMATYFWSGTEYYCYARRIYYPEWKIGGSWQMVSPYVSYDFDLYVTNGSATGGRGNHATCASYGPCAGYVNLQAEQ